MGTRGLVILKHGIKVRAYYNQFDSYPSVLGKELWLGHLPKIFKSKAPFAKLKLLIERRAEHNKNMNWPFNLSQDLTKPNHAGIDYLFHEWIYLIDYDKKRMTSYMTVWTGEKKTGVKLNKKVKRTDEGFLLPVSVDDWPKSKPNFKKIESNARAWRTLIDHVQPVHMGIEK